MKILVVDDDPELCHFVQRVLEAEGIEVVAAISGKEGLRAFHAQRPDLVLLDIMLPDIDGYELCHRLRDLSDAPIIMLTALSQEGAIVRALGCGADDYITKPFSIAVLRARIDAVLRRATQPHRPEQPAAYADGYLTVDPEQHRVLVSGQPVHLSLTEYKLLLTLIEHAGQLLTYRQLLEQVWGYEYYDQVEYLHVYISRLRHKLEANPLAPRYLLTEPRVGYRFESAPFLAPSGHK